MRLRPKPKKIRYRCVAMDPPWNERGGGKITRGAQRHYPLVKTKDMPEVITGSDLWLPADDAHLWMWATCNHLPDALWLMKELGFRHVTDWVWVKDKIGLGQYRRSRHEWLLFGTRGKAMVPKPAWKTLLLLGAVLRPVLELEDPSPDEVKAALTEAGFEDVTDREQPGVLRRALPN